jgi:TM2 domain-containing membrane protein YozV
MVSLTKQQDKKYFNEDTGKSKILLLIIEALVGPLGFDRMYMGCYRSGIVKFLMPFIGIFLTMLFPPVGMLLLIGWSIWAFVDYVIVMVNALARWRTQPFTVGCGGNVRYWKDEQEIQNGFYLAMVLIILNIIESFIVPMFVPVKAD